MVLLHSEEIPLGTPAHPFKLYEPLNDRWLTLDELKGEKGTTIIFMCNHCPYVKHILDKLIEVAREYIPRGISFIGINPNDPVKYPEDSPDNMKKLAKEKNFPFPYLFDETQEIARKYGAQCTPEFYVYDSNLKLYYHGQFDDSRPGNNIPVSGADLKKALNALLNGEPPIQPQKPSSGCSIKWRE